MNCVQNNCILYIAHQKIYIYWDRNTNANKNHLFQVQPAIIPNESQEYAKTEETTAIVDEFVSDIQRERQELEQFKEIILKEKHGREKTKEDVQAVKNEAEERMAKLQVDEIEMEKKRVSLQNWERQLLIRERRFR